MSKSIIPYPEYRLDSARSTLASWIQKNSTRSSCSSRYRQYSSIWSSLTFWIQTKQYNVKPYILDTVKIVQGLAWHSECRQDTTISNLTSSIRTGHDSARSSFIPWAQTKYHKVWPPTLNTDKTVQCLASPLDIDMTTQNMALHSRYRQVGTWSSFIPSTDKIVQGLASYPDHRKDSARSSLTVWIQTKENKV